MDFNEQNELILAGYYGENLFIQQEMLPGSIGSALNIFCLQYRTDGSLKWARTFGEGTRRDYCNDLAVKDNYIYLTGTLTHGDYTLGNDIVSVELNDPFLFKLDSTGMVVDYLILPLNTSFSKGSSIAINQANELVWIGKYANRNARINETFLPHEADFFLQPHLFLLTIDPLEDLAIQTIQTIESLGDYDIPEIIPLSDNSFLATGYFNQEIQLGDTQFNSAFPQGFQKDAFVGTFSIIDSSVDSTLLVMNETAQVAGKITNTDGENIEAVELSVNGGMASMATQNNGEYSFTLFTGEDYTITPEKNVNPLNGVSTFDLVLITQHILGVQTLETPYKHIAADVNKSGSITTFDVVQLRQLILNITTEFPSNDSWRFVEAAHTFGTSPLTENFNEFISINNLAGSVTNANFIAVKVGDVNGSAQPNSLTSATARNANGTMNLRIVDQAVIAGQDVSVAFTSADIAAIAGYQFTMNYTGLELAQLVDGVATAANFNTNLRGALTTSWNGVATANDVLFTLNFTATTSGNLSELLSVGSDAVAAEAYTAEGELLNVGINFTTTAAGFGLEQNTPNPFNAETVIGFNLPTAGTATFKVMDIQGKVLKSVTADYAKGYNQISINAKELGATGVFYYQLESADNLATKKMILQ